jgi:hypothetical protein
MQYFVAINYSLFGGGKTAYLVHSVFSWIVTSRIFEGAAVERVSEPGLLQLLK